MRKTPIGAAPRRWRARLLALLVLLPGGFLRADLVIEQQVEGAQAGQMTIRLKEGKSRADLAQPISTITDAASGETVLLQHAQKTYVRLPASQTKALAEQLVKSQGGTAPRFDATGQKTAIGGYACELHVWTVGALRMRFWVAKDYPNAAAIQGQLDRLQSNGLGAVAASLMPKPGQLPGVRLRTELDLAGQKVSYTITSIRETPVDPAVFEIPAGYAEQPFSLGTTPAE